MKRQNRTEDTETKMPFERSTDGSSKKLLWIAFGAILVLGAILYMRAPRSQFSESDGWFLAAVGNVDADRVPLERVIARADAMNYAIISRREVNGALRRLHRGGYVTRHPDGTFELMEAGRSLVAKARKGNNGLYDYYQRVVNLLWAAQWTSRDDPRRADEEAGQVSKAEYAAALRSYRDSWKRPS